MQHISRDLCMVCDGTGVEPEDGITCPACRGTGRRLRNTRRASRRTERLVALMITLAIWAVAAVVWAWVSGQRAEAEDAKVPSYLSAEQRADRGLPARTAALPPSVTVERTPAAEGVPSAGATTDALTGSERLRKTLWAPLLTISPEQLALADLIAYAQDTAAEILRVCPSAPRENVRIASQEWALLRELHPEHSAIRQRTRALVIIRGECTFTPPCVTPPAGASGWFQIIESTAADHGYNMARLRSTDQTDLRYSLRCGFDLLTGDQWQHWAATDPGRAD